MTRLEAVFGPAGVGKSYYINNLIKEDKCFGIRSATTGIAALNMGTIQGTQEPTTINRVLRYSTVEDLLHKYIKNKTFFVIKHLATRYKNIIIDEAGMLNSATLDLIVKSIENYNNQTQGDFGLLLSGDIAQLPPVEGKPIFEAKCWDQFNIINLTEVKRQDDVEFINALHFIRKGDALEAIDWFTKSITFIDTPNILFRGTTLFSTNNEVNIFNNRRLALLQGKEKVYTASLEGTEDPTWKNIDRVLTLKQGAVVQLLYNDFEYGFANGDLAIVDDLWENSIQISLLRKNRQIHLKPRKLEHFSLNSKGYLNKKPDGVLKLLHVKLAAAQSYHKSQGLTLDKLQVNLKGPGKNFIRTQSGMLYTALSRVRTPQGLVIVGTPQDLIDCCYVNPSYKKWIV